MKSSELRAKSATELISQLGEWRQEIMNLRVQQASGQLENPARLRTVRRGIARARTLLAEKSRQQAAK